MSIQHRLFYSFFSLLLGTASVGAAESKAVSFVNAQGIRITAHLFHSNWSGPRPTVVVMHGCADIYSLSDPSKGLAKLYLEWGTRLMQNGYHALVVDSFTARGTAQNQCGNGSAGVSEVSDRPLDAYAAARWLVKRPEVNAQALALLGWSHGGSSVFATMSETADDGKSPRFKSAFSFYPGCGLYNAFGGISTSTYVPYAPLLILHGSADPLYQSGYCQTRLANAQLLNTNRFMEMIAYPSAKHSFDNARAFDANWTIYDVNAKTSADAEIMNRLGYLR